MGGIKIQLVIPDAEEAAVKRIINIEGILVRKHGSTIKVSVQDYEKQVASIIKQFSSTSFTKNIRCVLAATCESYISEDLKDEYIFSLSERSSDYLNFVYELINPMPIYYHGKDTVALKRLERGIEKRELQRYLMVAAIERYKLQKGKEDDNR